MMGNQTTLLVVNWNTRRVLELCLKSFVKHHYMGDPLKLMLIDNGSTDDSKQWLTDNRVPFIDLSINIGHEAAVNLVYKKIDTRFVLLCDSDIEFKDECLYDIINFEMEDRRIAAGELIDGDNLGYAIKPRIGAWWFLFNISIMRDKEGVMKFRDTNLWNYDTGSWMTEQIFQRGYTHYQIDRIPGDIDRDEVGMRYPKFDHFNKLSWATSHHKDRIEEIAMRMRVVDERLKMYENIDLKNKFI